MPTRDGVALGLLVASILWLVPRPSQGGGGACELSLRHSDVLYNYSLASPTDKFPHGVLSEDGFYKVTVNETSLWFQVGFIRTDQNSPQKGVVVKTSSIGPKVNCSLSVSVFCDSNEAQVSDTFNITGNCDYAVVLRHPSGCAKVIYVNGKGWGWFGTLMMIILCLLVGYVLVGTIYRFFFLGIQGIEAIPNLEFWLSLPYRASAFFDLENGNQELKSDLKDLYISSATQMDVAGNRKAVVIHVPYRLRKAFRKIHVRLVRELEKKFSGKDVVLIATRRILRPPKKGSAVVRPRSRTLTAVHDAILEDAVYPAEIVGKRIRYRLDGSKIIKIFLDPKERNNTEYKLETFTGVYRKLCGKDVVFEYPVTESA
ncbi:hypothetical protein C4D60_Mb09t04190 [Musa balbisiana]|uniref:40S ribosomal protein S7 n=1 Tax=Musa balbisiana TaxID=52838 RepID=A0A4S8IDW9_MUSBA|nr:hypothetical protein C4D60_Mb09t04190 [Musa balbisiana]